MNKWYHYIAAVVIPVFYAAKVAMSSGNEGLFQSMREWFFVSIPLHFFIIGQAIWKAKSQHLFVRVGLGALSVFAINDILVAENVLNTPRMMDVGFLTFIISMMIRELVNVKHGWLALSQREAELELSRKYLSELRQISHDIKSPMTVIDNAFNSLKRVIASSPLATDPSVKQNIGDLGRGMSRIKAIASRLLTEKRELVNLIEQDEKREWVKQTLVEPLVESAVSEAVNALSPDIEVQRNGLDGLPGHWVIADIVETQNAIINVIRNAAEAMADIKDRKHVLKIDWRITQKRGILVVEDSGKGIPSAVLSKVFVEGFTHGKSGGTGLGLSQVKKCMEEFGGSVSIESKEGQGTRATLEFTLVDAPKWIATSIDLKDKRAIYFVDDDASVLGLWREKAKILAEKNFEYHALYSTKELENVDLTDVVLVLDQHIENDRMTGTEWLRQLSDLPDVYLCTTAYDEAHIQDEVRRLGIKIIPKPLVRSVGFGGIR